MFVARISRRSVLGRYNSQLFTWPVVLMHGIVVGVRVTAVGMRNIYQYQAAILPSMRRLADRVIPASST